MISRLTMITVGLVAASIPPTVGLWSRYGRTAGLRFALGSSVTILAQQSLVRMAASRKRARFTPVDAMTLSRGLPAAVLVGLVVSGVRHRTGLAGWLGWISLLYGSIVCDWLDGPIARRLGMTSELGALLDLESDSWLTLASASSATAWGGLPAFCMAAPLARYALLMAALRRIPYDRVYADEPAWARPFGIAQMALFTAATAPFGGAGTRAVVRLATPIVAPMQLLGMFLLYRRSQRRFAT
ncbi:MAG TPA: CDP-alcohol phosphatidyltransferase family protein [Candidatus Dormibacteraeota bacterium]|nr:CDP-alcohol phosphatidyltransferase family protein [Candidatus Dormibacteraeota bacterium]